MNRRRGRRSATLLAGAVGLAAGFMLVTRPIRAQTVAYTGSLNWSTGEYVFDQRSHAVILHNGLTARLGRFRTGISLPLVWQNTYAVNLVGDTWIPTGGPDHGAIGGRSPGQTVPTGKGRRGGGGGPGMTLVPDTVAVPDGWEMNLADPLFSSGVEIWSGWGVLRSIELMAAVKPPIASIESGVGTGAWDWSAGAGIALGAGRTLFFADASYWSNGDMPDLELRDGIGWGLGVGVPATDRLSILASLTGSEPIVDSIEAPLSLSVAGAYTLGRRSIHAGFAAGLSEASPDLMLYAGWRVDLLSRRPVF